MVGVAQPDVEGVGVDLRGSVAGVVGQGVRHVLDAGLREVARDLDADLARCRAPAHLVDRFDVAGLIGGGVADEVDLRALERSVAEDLREVGLVCRLPAWWPARLSGLWVTRRWFWT